MVRHRVDKGRQGMDLLLLLLRLHLMQIIKHRENILLKEMEIEKDRETLCIKDIKTQEMATELLQVLLQVLHLLKMLLQELLLQDPIHIDLLPQDQLHQELIHHLEMLLLKLVADQTLKDFHMEVLVLDPKPTTE